MIISIINNTALRREEVQTVVRAINRQMQEDFKRYWHRDVELRLEGRTEEKPDPDEPVDMRGDAVIYLWDKLGPNDPFGYHDLTAAGIPFGFVFTELSKKLGEKWSVTLSHEVLELAMDPEVNILVQGPHPDPAEGGRTVFHWYELCDAVQTQTYLIDEVEVSNFVLPHYFTLEDEHLNHNDFLGTGLSSFQVAAGGYAGFFDPETGEHETWSPPDDQLARDRKKLKQKFSPGLRIGRHAESDGRWTINNTNEVACDALIFELDAKTLDTGTSAFQYASQLVQGKLGENWYLEPVESDEFEFDAVYKGEDLVSFAEAWDLVHAIAEDPAIVFVEPSISNPVIYESDKPSAHEGDELRASGSGDAHLPGTTDPLWAVNRCKIPQAWALVRTGGKEPGEGIRIGHPDSGYRVHKELDRDRLLTAVDIDFEDDDDDASNKKGNHGLSTATVIMSGDNAIGDVVKGPALAADLLPMRVTTPGWIRPAPVLLLGGMRRLRKSIDYATRMDCHVISMSLGGLPSRSVRKAIQRATDAGLIVLAAAGNEVGFVVWPARYEDCIAVAGSNINDRPWDGSSHGGAVNITAPGESVWRARIADDDSQVVGRGSGTSYAVALTAGTAAMWLSHHGHANLVATYRKERIQSLFRSILEKTANSNHQLPDDGYGAGLLDAEALLSAQLPSPRAVRRRSTDLSDENTVAASKRSAKRFGVAPRTLSGTLADELLMAEALGAFSGEAEQPPEHVHRAATIHRQIKMVPPVSKKLRKALLAQK